MFYKKGVCRIFLQFLSLRVGNVVKITTTRSDLLVVVNRQASNAFRYTMTDDHKLHLDEVIMTPLYLAITLI
jgi:hypothetical protein